MFLSDAYWGGGIMKLRSAFNVLLLLPAASFSGREWMIRGLIVQDAPVYMRMATVMATVKF